LNVAQMRDDLERLLDDLTLVTLALAIAAGWSLYQVAHGFATFVDALSVNPENVGVANGLTWVVGGRYVTLDGLVIGLLELAVVLIVAVFIARRTNSDT
jgi:hypothetical protein